MKIARYAVERRCPVEFRGISRAQIIWRPPFDVSVYGVGSRSDPGGYCYSVWIEGKRVLGGTASDMDLEGTRKRVLGLASGMGLGNIPVIVLSVNPRI